MGGAAVMAKTYGGAGTEHGVVRPKSDGNLATNGRKLEVVGIPIQVPRAVFGAAVALALMPVGAIAATTWQGAVRLDQVSDRYRGSGVGVALIDTGVTPSADLGGRLLARVDLTPEGDGIDHYGHGTHMAGLIAGDGTFAGGAAEGAAPAANIVSVKVAGWDGATDVTTVIAGLRWAVANRDRYGLRVINLSYGTDSLQQPDSDPLDYAVERAWAAGLAVVVSAGNDAGPVSKPGDDPFVITVGAADVHDTVSVADDTVAAFSSVGPRKPDLVAPGVSLVSLRAPGSTVDVFNETARVGDAYFKGSGTSQATAVVSGVIARMIDGNPALTPDQIKGALIASANGVLTGPGAGAGLVDADQAMSSTNPSKKGKGSGPIIPRANRGVVASTGLGSIAASRGTEPVVADLDADGVPEPVTGEVDVLGNPWDAAAFAATPWTAAAFAASPWTPLTTELTAAATLPAAAAPPRVAWEARHWGATDWVSAGWDAQAWAARHWGARHWGAFGWQ